MHSQKLYIKSMANNKNPNPISLESIIRRPINQLPKCLKFWLSETTQKKLDIRTYANILMNGILLLLFVYINDTWYAKIQLSPHHNVCPTHTLLEGVIIFPNEALYI